MDKKDPWPRIRLGHQAACCFGFNSKRAQLLISGGRIRQDMPLKDLWIFDLMSRTWKEVRLVYMQLYYDDIYYYVYISALLTGTHRC